MGMADTILKEFKDDEGEGKVIKICLVVKLFLNINNFMKVNLP